MNKILKAGTFIVLLWLAAAHLAVADCVSADSGLIGWWPGDGNANNIFGTNNGTLQGGATASAAGTVGTAFGFDGTNSFVQIPDSSVLRPTNLTIEAWVRFAGLDSAGSGGSPAGDQYIVFRQNSRSSDFEGFDLSKTRAGGSDVFRFLIASATGQTVEIHSATTISAGVWYHVAAIRGSNFTQIYVNGNLERQTNISFAQDYGNFPLYFGTSGQPSWDHKLKGNLDEVSLYNRALSAGEIAAIFAAGAAGKCKAPTIFTQPQSQTVAPGSNPTFTVAATGFGALAYQWRLNGAAIPGATSNSFTATNVQLSQIGNYSVLVSNSLVSVLSSNATLSLCRVVAWGNNNYGQTNLPPGLTNVLAVSAGVNHALALTGDGRIIGWGYGGDGEYSFPSTLSNTVAISAGLAHSLALQANGIVVACGNNVHGEGVVPPGLSNVVAISAGYDHNMALKVDGTVTCWGEDFWGQSSVPPGLSNVVAIAAGGFRSMALTSDGTVTAWGNGGNFVPPGLRNVIAITAGEWFSVALRSDGTIFVWGDNSAGQDMVPSGLSNLVSIAAGDYFTMALKGDGSVVDWQDNYYGEANIPASVTNITAISGGSGYGLALMDFTPLSILRQPASQASYSGETAYISVAASGVSPLSYQWRFNGTNIAGATSSLLALTNVQSANAGNYQVMVSNSAGSLTSATAALSVLHSPPSIIAQPLTQQVLLGSNATWTVSGNGSLPLSYQWQFNGANIPGATNPSLTLANLQFASAGNYSVLVTNSFGSSTSTNAQLSITPVAAWGDDSFGQTDVPFGLSNVLAVAGGSTHSLALKPDGTVAAWGFVGYGATTVPAGLVNVVAVAGGSGYSMALKGDGTVVSWGSGPAVPPGVNNVVAIAAGDYHSLALKADYTVLAWGSDTYGQTNVPPGLSNVVAIAAGAWNSLALKSDGTVVVWGSDINGDTDVPPGTTNIVAIAQGGVHNLTLREDGTPIPWGDGTYAENTLPNGFSSNIVAVATGFWHSLALRNDGTPVVWGDQNFTPAGIRNVIALSGGGSHNLALVNDGSPVIISHPLNLSLNQLVASGNNVFVAVPVTGAQPLTCQWFFNGVLLADGAGVFGSATPYLNLANAQTNATGSYQLVASNAFGVVTSVVATITVLDVPAISLQPSNQIALVGSNIVFNAAATGSQPLTYTWYFNGSPLAANSRISGTASTSLSISNVQTSDAGQYALVVTNPVGAATSAVAQLTVWVPPTVTLQPFGRSVPPGLPTTFTASGSGTAPLNYQWQLNGVDIAGATNGTLTLAAVGTNDLGAYHLLVSNIAGVISSSDAALTFGPVAAWGNNQQRQCLPPPGLTNVIAIAGGLTYSMALRSDGTVVAWGSGAGTNLPPGLTNIVAIAAGSSDTGVALRSDGTVASWNSSVNGTNFANALSNIVALCAGQGFDVALRSEGVVRAWVANGSFPASPPQVAVPAGLTRVVGIAAGVNQSIALRDDGTVAVWGTGITTNVPNSVTNAVAVGSGFNHAIVLKANGKLTAWGSGFSTNIPATLSNVAAIAVGSYAQGQSHDMALLSNNTVVVWGDNGFGEANTPPALTNSVTVAVAGGGYHSLALVNGGPSLILRPPVGGTVFSGRDVVLNATAAGAAPLNYQWLRNGTNIPGATQTALSLPGVSVADAANYQVVVSNAFGVAASVPAPLTVLDSAPFFVQPPVQTNYAYLATKFAFTSAVGGSGPLQFTWLFNGQPLSGPASDTLLLPRVQVTNSGAYILIVSNGFGSITSSVVNLTVLSVVAWGAFDIFYNETNTPASLTNAIAISAGPGSSLALRADGTALAWGHYQGGETNIPSTFSNLVEIAAGNGCNLALRSDGTVLGFGNINTNALAGLSNIVAMEADISGTTFLRPDGTVARLIGGSLTFPPAFTNVVALNHYVNGYSMLRADGTVWLSNNSKVATASNILQIALSATGGDEELFLRRDGSVLGAGRLVGPVAVSNAIDIAASGDVGAATRPDGTVAAWGAAGPPTTNVPPGLANVAVLDGGQHHFMALLADRAFPPVFLPNALNTTALVLSSKNSPQWFGQTTVSHDGLHAAQSAPIGRNTASSMRALVNGPIIVRFWWKVSSETNHDFLTFSIAGTAQAAISGEQDWQQLTYTLPAGPQMLVWTYSKDGSGSAGLDAAWVDQLELIAFQPTISSQPLSQTVLRGTNVTFSVSASGTPPLSYQWWKNGIALTGQSAGSGGPNPFIAPSFTLTNVTRTNSGIYTVVITNVAGALTSSPAILTVHVPQRLRLPGLQTNGAFVLLSGDFDGGPLSSNNLAGFHLLASTNLTDWAPVPASMTISNGLLLIQDTNTAFPARFYRVEEDW